MMYNNVITDSDKYQLIMENSQEMILYFDQMGKIIEVNRTAENELGYGQDIYSSRINDIFSKIITFEDNCLIINEKYQNQTVETVAYRKNQTCISVNLKIELKMINNVMIGICSAINISEKKHLLREYKYIKTELKEVLKQKNEYVANVTHELKTPVNGIHGLTEYLLETELSPKQLETVNIIHRCCNNMIASINAILDYIKIKENKMVLEQREFHFRNFIDHIISVNLVKISEKGLDLFVDIAEDIPTYIIGDELRLTSILNNLFSNAIKFTSVGQIALEVVMTARTEHTVELFFMIMDTGIGISAEERNKLFMSFTQVDGSITRRFGGTGLGLSISKMIIESMHGTMNVESEKNKGSTFSFTAKFSVKDDKRPVGVECNKKEQCTLSNRIAGALLMNENDEEILPDRDYVGRMLDKANCLNQYLHGFRCHNENRSHCDSSMKNVSDAIERLIICIEMDSWEKAESLVDYIKGLIPKDEKKHIMQTVLRLVLAVRKEDHDTSLAIINEFKDLVYEVSAWKA